MTLELLILSSAWCIGFHAIVKNAILETGNRISFEVWWNDLPRVNKFVLKPLFACPYCMASIHGTAIHFLTGGTLIMWIPFCVCLCGITYFATQFFTE